MVLICDGCGQTHDATHRLLDAEVVWPLLAANGWTGSPFATGQHWCPRCDPALIAASAEGDGQPTAREPVPCRVGVRQWGEVTLVTLSGDLQPMDSEHVQAALTAAVAAGRHILLDLAGVGALDSASLSAIVRAYGDSRLRGYALCLVAPSRYVRVVLHTMRLDRVITIFDDQRDALAWLDVDLSGSPAGQHTGVGAHVLRIPTSRRRQHSGLPPHVTSHVWERGTRGPGR